MEFDMDAELDGFLEQFEAIPIEVADEMCVTGNAEDIKKLNSEKLATAVEVDNNIADEVKKETVDDVPQKDETSEEKKKQLSILSDSLESGEYISSECESQDNKPVLLKGRSLYQQVLEFKSQRLKDMQKHKLASAKIDEENVLTLPGKPRSRNESSSSCSSSFSGKETLILPLRRSVPVTDDIGRLDEVDVILKEKLKCRNVATSSPMKFEDSLGSKLLLKNETLSSLDKCVKQDMVLFDNKLKSISSQVPLDDIDNLLKKSEKVRKANLLSENKDTGSVSVTHTFSASVVTKMEVKTELNGPSTDCKAEISRWQSSCFSPISNSSLKLEKKDALSLSSISPPTDEDNANQNILSSKSLIVDRELKDYGSLSPAPSDATQIIINEDKKEKKRKRKRSKNKKGSKSKSLENEKISRQRKTHSKSPVRKQKRSRSRSSSVKKGQLRSSRSIEGHSKSRSRSRERTTKRQRRTFSRSNSRSRSTEKGTYVRQMQYFKRSRSRSYENGVRRNQSYCRSPAHRLSRSRSGSSERRTVKRRKWYRRESRSRSIERRAVKRPSKSKSRSPYKRISKSPKRKRSLSKTPPLLRKTSSSMSISPLTSDENTIVTNMPAVNDPKQASLQCVDVKSSPFPQPQPIPSVVGHVQPPPNTENEINYYDNYYYSQDVPYGYPSNFHMPDSQLPYYYVPEQNYWNPESGLQDNFYYSGPHYSHQANLRQVLLSATVPPPLPSGPPPPPLPPSEPASPPPPPPPETDNSLLLLTPEKGKPSKLMSRLKSNLRYILPEITKKVHTEEVVKLIDRSLESPQKLTPSVSSSTSGLEEEMPRDNEQAEKCISWKLQEVTFEGTSASKHCKPSSESGVKQPSQLLTCNNTFTEQEYGNKNNNVTVKTQAIPSIIPVQETSTKQSKPYAIIKPKSNSKYSPVVLKLLPRRKLVSNINFTGTDNDEDIATFDTNEYRVIQQIPFQPNYSSSRSSLIHINTSGALPTKRKHEQEQLHPPGVTEDSSSDFSISEQKNNLTNNSKEKEFDNDNAGNAALKNKTKINFENMLQDTCRSKEFKDYTVTETGLTSDSAGEDIKQGKHLTVLANNANGIHSVSKNTVENKITSNYLSPGSEIDTSAIVNKGNPFTATIREANLIEKEELNPVMEDIFGKNSGSTGTTVFTAVSDIATRAKDVSQINETAIFPSKCSGATTITKADTFADGIGKEISKNAMCGRNLGGSGTPTFAGANATKRAKIEVNSKNALQNSESVLQNAANSTINHDERVTSDLKIKKKVPVTQDTFGYTNDGLPNGTIENETSEPKIQCVSESAFSSKLHKEELKEIIVEVSRSDANKASLLPRDNNESEGNRNKLAPEVKVEGSGSEETKEELKEVKAEVSITEENKQNPQHKISNELKFTANEAQGNRNKLAPEVKIKVEGSGSAETKEELKEVKAEVFRTEENKQNPQHKISNELKFTANEAKLLPPGNNEAQGNSNKLAHELVDLTKVQVEGSGSEETKEELKEVKAEVSRSDENKQNPQHKISNELTFTANEAQGNRKNKSNMIENKPVSKVDSMSPAQKIKPISKARGRPKKFGGDSPHLNAEKSQREKYKHKSHDKKQASPLLEESIVTELQQSVAEYINRKSKNGVVDVGNKEAGDNLGESSKGKGYDMELVGITYEKQQHKKKEQSTTARAATVKFDHRKQVWEDPKLNMNVKVKLERCKALPETINMAVKDHNSQTFTKTKQPQGEKLELVNKISSCSKTSLSTHASVAVCTSKNTKDFTLEENKIKDSSRKTKSKEQKSKTTKNTSTAVQNLSMQDSVKEEGKDISAISAGVCVKSRIEALEEVISILTVPRRTSSTQVRFKAKTLEGTHEVRGHHAPMRVKSSIVACLKEMLQEYKSGT